MFIINTSETLFKKILIKILKHFQENYKQIMIIIITDDNFQ